MYEALLDVGISSEVAHLDRSFHAGYATAEKMVVLQQIYTNTGSQENVRAICRQLAREAGVRLIAVEGAEGRVAASPSARSVLSLLQTRCAVSAGVQVLIQVDHPDAEVWGVDHLESEARSADAMDRANRGRQRTEQVFRLLGTRLNEAQQRCYSRDFARLRRLQCAVYGNWKETSRLEATLAMPLTRVIDGLLRLAPKEGVDLRSFPALPLYHRLFGGSKRRVQQDRVEAERSVFGERLVRRVFAGTGGLSGVDLSKMEPVIQFWAEKNGITNDEFNESIQVRGVESLLSECFEWVNLWLTERAIAAQSGRSGSAEAFEQMQVLALRLSVPYFDLESFRTGVAYMREVNELSALGLVNEVNECARAIASRSSIPGAAKLFDFEQALEQLYLALRLELVPVDAESTDISMEALSTLVADVNQLANRPDSDMATLRLDSLSSNVAAAHEFYRLSLERGRSMAAKTLELMRSRGEDRAILVAGGFHERAITRALEDNRDVSWSVVLARPTF